MGLSCRDELTRVEVDVGIQLALDEVLVVACSLFERDGDVYERVAALDFEDLLRHGADDLGARIEVFVDPAT